MALNLCVFYTVTLAVNLGLHIGDFHMRKLFMTVAAAVMLAAPALPAFALTSATAGAGGVSNSFAVGAAGGKSASLNVGSVNSNAVGGTVGGAGFVGNGVVAGGGSFANANVTQGNFSAQTSSGPAISGAGGVNGGFANAQTLGF
jgi:hypothetical protein